METRRGALRITEIFVYGVALLCLVGLFFLAGRYGFTRLSHPRWMFLLGALAVTLLFMTSTALRYWAVLGLFLKEVGGRPALLPVFFSTVFGMTAGLLFSRGAGQVFAKPAILWSREGYPLNHALYGSVLERVMDLMTGMLLCVPLLIHVVMGGSFIRSGIFTAFWILLIVWGVVSLVYIHRVLEGIHWLLGRFACWLPRLGILRGENVSRALYVFVEKLGPWGSAREGTLFIGCSLSRVVLMSIRLYLIAMAFHVPVPWKSLVLGVPLVQMSLLFAITPGSLGFLEAGWYAVLAIQGVPPEHIWSMLIGLRVINYLFFPLVTLCTWAIYRPRVGPGDKPSEKGCLDAGKPFTQGSGTAS